MGWINNRLMRGASNRANQRLGAEFGFGPATATLALAIGHACYPTAVYGDNGVQDEIVRRLKQFSPRPCRPQEATQHFVDWMDNGLLSTETLFRNVWSSFPDQFLERFFEKSAEESPG